MKKISVVICTHNRSRLLEKTLDGLLAQEVPHGLDWEVCVVDNNSTDDTAAVVAGYAARHQSPTVRRVLEKRPGVAFARNAGVEQAAGDVIAFVDDDVVVAPGWLRTVQESYVADDDLAILGGRLLPNPQSPPPGWLAQINTAPLGLIDYGDKRIVINFPYLATANCAFRKTDIVAAGMFNTKLGRLPDKLHADEDTDMVYRIINRGGKVVYDPAMSGLHFIPDSRMTKTYFRRWYRERGEGLGLAGTHTGRRLFGVALFEYRALLVNGALFVRNAVLMRETFQQELFLRYAFGIFAGRLKKLAAVASGPAAR